MNSRWLALLPLLLSLMACEKIALWSTPPQKAAISNTPLAIKAKSNFWQTLHQGNYQALPETDYSLMEAYLETPNDPELAAYLGFVHIWKITERARLKTQSPLIPNQIVLAKNYFKDALKLEPSNPIYRGFYGDTQLFSGKIFQDEREQVSGYFTLKDAITQWPQFNYFTAGYPMSTLPPESKYFKEGLEWQWQTLNLCAGKTIDRSNPNFAPFMRQETHAGANRACWNSNIAPHNFEGFFLNMGDMLVKAGQIEAAIKIYNNAKLSKTYNQWPYKNFLEKRIFNAKANTRNFQESHLSDPDKTILLNSGYGCVACHQRR